MTLSEIVRSAKEQLTELTGLEADAVSALERYDNGWRVTAVRGRSSTSDRFGNSRSSSLFRRYARICPFVEAALTNFSQSDFGPPEFLDVMICTRSPVASSVSIGTIRSLTLAPTRLLPTSVWM